MKKYIINILIIASIFTSSSIFNTTSTMATQNLQNNTQEEFNNLLNFARDRLTNAAPVGAHIVQGRHNLTDIEALRLAILDAEQQSQNSYNMLQNALDAFRASLIDTYNVYRPFLDEIELGESTVQKHHLRAVWIATVVNIDWPSVNAMGTSTYHVDRQKTELIARFDEMAYLGFNAVIFQVSPTADAMFYSDIVPLSPWLTGETNFTGKLLDSDGNIFDPLEFAIKLARERNMELHAWFNPYRIVHSISSYRNRSIVGTSSGRTINTMADIRNELSTIENHPFNIFGHYVRYAGGWYVLDPGLPPVRDWIVDRVMEVVTNYDIDAVHFDDYFYPSNFPDHYTFLYHNPHNKSFENWRRHNTEMLMREVAAAINQEHPWVKFGVSPGGVWKSAAEGNTGLDGGAYNSGTGSRSTTAWSNYHSSFVDTRLLVIEGIVDYITPQIYWDFAHPTAPYGYIAKWWSRLISDFGPNGHLRNSLGNYTTTHLYIGTGLYRLENPPSPKWQGTPEFEMEGMRTFLRQEHYNLGNPHIHGSMIFTQNQTRPGRGNGMRQTMETLRQGAWRYYALVPPMPHLGGIAPSPPQNITINNNTIYWQNSESSTSPLVAVRYFVIYKSLDSQIDINNPANIVALIPAIPNKEYYSFTFDFEASRYNFGITAVNRLHDESSLGTMDVLKN